MLVLPPFKPHYQASRLTMLSLNAIVFVHHICRFLEALHSSGVKCPGLLSFTEFQFQK